MTPQAMELVVDARRLYKKNPRAVEQAVENLKKTGLSAVSEAADRFLQIAKGEQARRGEKECI